MICWDAGGYVTGYPENEDYDLDVEPDRFDERLVDTVWLRVKRWARDHQSLPDVSKEEKKDHFFLKGMSEQSASWSKNGKDRTRK